MTASTQKVTVLGPNLPRPLCDKGTLHVHAADCADIKRRYSRVIERDGWDLEISSVREVIYDIYPPESFDYDGDDASEYSGYRSDVAVFPCVTVPEESPSTEQETA